MREQATAPLQGIDLEGKLHRLGSRAGTRAVAVIFLSIDCPISNGCLPLLRQLRTDYRHRGVEFFGVMSDPQVSRAEALAHRKSYRIGFPVLFDGAGELRQRLGATHTPHAFLLDNQGRTVYQGAINDEYAAVGRRKLKATQQFLQEGLQSLLAGTVVKIPRTTPIGCLMERSGGNAAEGAVTYARHIAPIIQAQCVTCHRAGQAAPFALQSYSEVSRHARQIVAVTRSRFMPPWKAAPGFGDFRGVRRLSEHEIDLLERWERSGKPEGKAVDLPPPADFPSGWRLGEPDKILQLKEAFKIPAGSSDFRQYFVFPLNLATNQVVRAVEFHPGNARVVHHASFILDTRRVARRLDAADPNLGYRHAGGWGFAHSGTLRSWLPGMTPQRLPRGTGRLVRRGSDLVVEVHYHPTGKPELDQFQLGLHLESSLNKKFVLELQVHNKRLKIPAGTRRHHHRSSYELPVATKLLDVVPHMHLLGREMKAIAVLPGGRRRPLVWIKDWDFNWQAQYTYTEAISLPKGTRIEVDSWYDNSAGNPFNPHSPPRTVCWGPDTDDEMDICHFQCVCENLDDIKTLYADHDRYVEFQASQRPN